MNCVLFVYLLWCAWGQLTVTSMSFPWFRNWSITSTASPLILLSSWCSLFAENADLSCFSLWGRRRRKERKMSTLNVNPFELCVNVFGTLSGGFPCHFHLAGSFWVGGPDIVCTHQPSRFSRDFKTLFLFLEARKIFLWSREWQIQTYTNTDARHSPIPSSSTHTHASMYHGRRPNNPTLEYTLGRPVVEKTPTLQKQEPVKYSIMLYSWGHFLRLNTKYSCGWHPNINGSCWWRLRRSHLYDTFQAVDSQDENVCWILERMNAFPGWEISSSHKWMDNYRLDILGISET